MRRCKGGQGFNPDVEVEFDPDQARRVLEDAGMTELDLRAVVTGDAATQNLPSALQAQWGEIGVDLELVTTTVGAQELAEWTEGNFDLWVTSLPGAPDLGQMTR